MTGRRRAAALALLVIACGASVSSARADVFRPAYLELREAGADRYDVLWKVPAAGEDRRLAATVRFPEGTIEVERAPSVHTGAAHVERWRIARPGGLVGHRIHIDGIAGGVTDVLVRVERLDGTSQVERLLPERPSFTVVASAGRIEVARSYTILGIEHILGGVDHLLFVLALLLLVHGARRVVATVTAFTIAHSITLAAATLGWVHVASAPVEAVIALSIAFVAAEIVHGLRGQPGLTARAPWVVAFSFGLLHGLGFAGALAEVGLPERAIPLALFAFNAGVEIGQLLFVAAVLALRAAFRRIVGTPPVWTLRVPAYAIGTVAMYWVFERLTAF